MKRTKFLFVLFAFVATVVSAISLCACGTPADLKAVFAKYSDSSKWNFATKVVVSGSGGSYEDYYEYRGDNILYSFEGTDGTTYTDYLGYNAVTDIYYYYCDNGDGTHTKYAENTDDFTEYFSYMNVVYLSEMKRFSFVLEEDGGYTAKRPNAVGNAVLGEFEDSTWKLFSFTVANGYVTEIFAVTSDNYTFTYEFSKYGLVNFTLPGEKPAEPTGTMESQVYNEATFDRGTIQDKLTTVGQYPDPAIGLPSTGTYNVLVIPVKFSDTTISQTQMNNLNTAFNGTSEETGWESVKTYYQKASYGKLNLSFDIAGYGDMSSVGYYTSKKSSEYYAGLTATEDGQTYNNGDNVLLQEVLKYYESRLDLTKYDTNGDKTIDAVYLIYSAKVDYSDDSFYWAYVTWDYDETKYDGRDAFYYLFAGFGFMEESVQGGYTNQYYPVIPGLKINAATYIHETGHLLGLDDYYDYYAGQGSDEGLGGADMMDATVGDQNVYSKTMLGWLAPQIVTTTQTITIQSSQAKGDAILIPLKFNNSYFCEYLLIDLYSAQGLNALHASISDSYLYDGADFGVRIYHVSSWIENAYDNDFGSFTDNNNSMSDIALIKLVEADGESKFTSSNGYATRNDLWQAGDKLSEAFPQYTTNDGKLLIFDITINSVSATEATITITYNA
ncbi:MAG: hypothetical protein K2K12_05130 [Clostridia bacterium]|nr:hypothetical protein [Clostridia bacterium]